MNNVTLERAQDYEYSGVTYVLLAGERVGWVVSLPTWSGRSRRYQPCSPTGIRITKPCKTRREAVVHVVLAYERRQQTHNRRRRS